jgi:hypothetical protein
MLRFTTATVAFASIAAVVWLAPPAHAAGQYVRTQSGLVRCLVTASDQSRGGAPTVACDYDRGFQKAPVSRDDHKHLQIAVVEASGKFSWDRGDIGGTPQNDLQLVTGQTLHIQGWTVAPVSDGTRFTNDGSGRGLFVRVDDVSPF